MYSTVITQYLRFVHNGQRLFYRILTVEEQLWLCVDVRVWLLCWLAGHARHCVGLFFFRALVMFSSLLLAEDYKIFFVDVTS